MAYFCQRAADIADEILLIECDEVFLPHEIADGRALADKPCRHVCIMWRADNFAVILPRQLLYGFGNWRAHADNDTACVHFNAAELVFKAVARQEDIAFLYEVFQKVGICRADEDFSFCNFFVRVTDNHFRIQRIQYICVFRAGHSQYPRFVNVHICRGNVLDGNDALQAAVLLHNGHGCLVQVAHGVPGVFQGNIARQHRCAFDCYVLDLCPDVADKLRRVHTEEIQYIFCFVIDFSCALGQEGRVFRFVFQICVGYRGADGIGIRIFMSNDKDLFFFQHKFSLLLTGFIIYIVRFLASIPVPLRFVNLLPVI